MIMLDNILTLPCVEYSLRLVNSLLHHLAFHSRNPRTTTATASTSNEAESRLSMTDNLIEETMKDLTTKDLEAAVILANMRVKATYSRAELDAAVTLVSLRSSNDTKATIADSTTTEALTQPRAEVLEAAAILTSMRGDTEYSSAEWDAAIALVKLKARSYVKMTDCPESPQSTITDKGHDSVTISESNSSGAIAETYGSDTVTPLLQRRVTRAMGFKMTTAAAYDMSYHPLDDGIGKFARSGGKNN